MKSTNNINEFKRKIIPLKKQRQRAIQLLLQFKTELPKVHLSRKRRRAEKIAPSCPL
jgi:hypothetical protein